AAQPQLRSREQPVDDHVIALDAVVDQLGAPSWPDHPERRHLTLADAGREGDEHLTAVVERTQWTPGWRVAFDPVAEVQGIDVDAGGDGRSRFGSSILPAQGDELVLGIGPGDRRHIGLLGGAELEM